MKETVLRLSSISKKYGNSNVLNNLNMAVNKKDIYGFIGQNGAGKTTALRAVMSIISPTSGSVEIFGCSDAKQLGISRGRIGAIIENPSFYPYLCAYDNLEYYLRFRGIANKSTIRETLAMVGLSDVGKKKYKDFSLGMKQRLGLGLALLDRPDLLILDEPLNGLDPKGIVEFREILSILNQKYGITIIMSSHNLDELTHIATRYGFINKGKIIQEISAEELNKKCEKYIFIEVDNVQKATVILEQELKTTNYEVINNQVIHLYDYVDTSEVVAKKLVSQGVGIKKIHTTNISLEEYFLNLLKKGVD